MSLSTPTMDNPEEAEIDRLLRELGITLPVVERVAMADPTVGQHGDLPQDADDTANLPDEVDDTQDWQALPLASRLTWPADTES